MRKQFSVVIALLVISSAVVSAPYHQHEKGIAYEKPTVHSVHASQYDVVFVNEIVMPDLARQWHSTEYKTSYFTPHVDCHLAKTTRARAPTLKDQGANRRSRDKPAV